MVTKMTNEMKKKDPWLGIIIDGGLADELLIILNTEKIYLGKDPYL